MTDGLLSGMRVLDLSVWRPGPYAVQLLADLGASVVKVEPPGGDPMRAFPELFSQLNRAKRTEELDLRTAQGQERMIALAADADVLVEGFRPGVMERLGAGYDAVRAVSPSIIYCSISGFGQDGPLRDLLGHDATYQAYAGVLAPGAADTPHLPSVPIGDLAAGLAAAFAVCAAYSRRLGTGEGERIDVGMADVLATWVGPIDDGVAMAGSHERMGRESAPAYGLFPTSDGRHLSLAVVTEDRFWAATCRALGLDDVADLTFPERTARGAELGERVAAAVSARPLGDLVDELQRAGVPAAPVLHRAEMLALEHFRERGTATVRPDGAPAMGHPVRYTLHPARPPV